MRRWIVANSIESGFEQSGLLSTLVLLSTLLINADLAFLSVAFQVFWPLAVKFFRIFALIEPSFGIFFSLEVDTRIILVEYLWGPGSRLVVLLWELKEEIFVFLLEIT